LDIHPIHDFLKLLDVVLTYGSLILRLRSGTDDKDGKSHQWNPIETLHDDTPGHGLFEVVLLVPEFDGALFSPDAPWARFFMAPPESHAALLMRPG
jgi:hypothetical protein